MIEKRRGPLSLRAAVTASARALLDPGKPPTAGAREPRFSQHPQSRIAYNLFSQRTALPGRAGKPSP